MATSKRSDLFKALWWTFIMSVTVVACTDDIVQPCGNAPQEGLPATVELKWDTETQSTMSRSQLSDKDASMINTLWIGVYDYNNEGKLLYQDFLTPGISFTDNEGNSTADIDKHTVRIHTTSGRRRIVAVANVRTNYGISDNDELIGELHKTGSSNAYLWHLSDILQKADTWDKFRSISACMTDSSSVILVSSNLAMSGIYHDDSSGQTHPDSWTDADLNSYVDIQPGQNKLPGAIHLRRLQSYIRFNIIPEPGINQESGKQITDMEIGPVSWQVSNVPIISYILEQQYNATDISDYFQEKLKTHDNYGTSAISYNFSNGELEKADRTPVYKQGTKEQAEGLWFDYYQYENKRTGLNSVTTYADREKEFKKADGTNSGIYASLCPNMTDTHNNFGSYVTVKIKLTYSYVNDDGHTVTRTAYPTYTVHTGYCEGATTAEKARDFNCRRNSRYTYNIRVTDVNSIKVEAEQIAELQPGAEGDVIDTYDNLITLDAHYCMWNIKISNHARRNIISQIRTFFNNNEYNFKNDPSKNITEINDALKGTDNFRRQMVDWITIMPTTGSDNIPKYKPHKMANGSTGSWTLDEFADPDSYPHTSASAGEDDSTEHWYTIFFNEYTYEYGPDGNKMINTQHGGSAEGGWEYYVNQPNRILWLSVAPNNISEDGQSTYSKSLFAFTQQSIQTYYSMYEFTPSGTAIGMEHTNETFGINFRWTWSYSGLSSENGRLNVRAYADGKQKWDELVTDKLLYIPAISAQSANLPATTHPVYGLYSNNLSKTLETDPQPDHKHYYEMIGACMNRNRDNNGDGKIDNDELRWYVPTTGKYLRLIIGRESMSDPLMDYSVSTLPYKAEWPINAKNTIFHFMTSNKQFVWAEEGLSITKEITSGADLSDNPSLTKWPPWQVRCIRNLGIDQSSIAQHDPVERAYIIDTDAHTVDLKYYNSSSFRAGISTVLPPHMVNEPPNMLSRKFQYAKNTIDVSLSSGSMEANIAEWKRRISEENPCGNYTEEGVTDTWRVPNQKELAVLRQMGQITTGEYIIYLTCTQEFYGKHRFMGATESQSQAIDMNNGDYKVWCVRDVIDGTRSEKKMPVSQTAPDFRFETRDGGRGSLSDMKGSIVLLLFYNPDCDHCRDAVALLRNDHELSRLTGCGKVKVLAVDAEEDYDGWQQTKEFLPQEWTVAYDRSGILDNGTYDLDKMPTLHILGPDGTILLNDADPGQALVKIKSIARNK